MYRYIFGPVLSSRLGRSLGVDLLVERICSYDCLYCESGPTLLKTLTRAEYADPELVLEELEIWIGRHPEYELDHITLGGEGEPCLNSGLGRIITGIKDIVPQTPVAVLTNSSLLTSTQVRTELMNADVVLPSMDTLITEEFIRLNRPLPGIDIQEIAKGLALFCREFCGRVFLEILLVRGINDSIENLEKTAEFLNQIKYDRLDITCMSRPGAHIQPGIPRDQTLNRWKKALKKGLSPDKSSQCRELPVERADKQAILASVQRRPQTLEQLCLALGLDREEAAAALNILKQERLIRVIRDREQNFYTSKGS